MGLSVQIQGIPQAIKAMQGLTPALRIRHMRIALNAAGGVIKRRIESSAPKDTGLLRKSQRVKVIIPQASKDPKHWDKPSQVIIGAGKGIVAFRSLKGRVSAKTSAAASKAAASGKGQVAFTRQRGKIIEVHASRYGHFAEKGRKGKGGTHFMERAAQSGANEATAKFASKIAQGIQQEAARLASKP